MREIVLIVFEEREDHQQFSTPQRHNRYTGYDSGKAKSLFKGIKNGQLVMIAENFKITLLKKNNEIEKIEEIKKYCESTLTGGCRAEFAMSQILKIIKS